MNKTMKIKKSIVLFAILAVSLAFTQFQIIPASALEFSTQKITLPSTDRFGWSIQRIGSGISVGEPFGDSGSGEVHLFDSNGDLTDTITNPNVGTDNFGYSLSALGNTLAIGAPGYSSDEGIVYLYDVSSIGTPISIENPSNTSGERMGEDEMNFIEGDLLVGVSKAQDGAALQAGKIYRFDTDGGSPIQTYLNPSPSTGDLFGRAISVDGNLFLTGAHGASGQAGEAHVLGSSPIDFTNPNTETPAGDQYGWSTEITPTRYLVGAPHADVFDDYTEQTVSQGLVYLHHRDSPAFDVISSPDLSDIVSQNVEDQFGYALAESDDFIVVGAPYDDVELGATTYVNAGSVYLYSRNGFFLEKMSNPDPANNDLFGHSLEIVNGLIVIGAPGDSSNSGAVYYLTVSNEFAATLTIDADPNTVQSGGSTEIIYTVKNIGSADLSDAIVTISSPNCPSIDGPLVDLEDDGILKSGEEWQFTCEITDVISAFTEAVNEADTSISYFPDPFEDPVTITCEDVDFDCSDTAEVTIQQDAITLDIVADSSTIYSGESTTVTFTVTNEGTNSRFINDGGIVIQGCTPIVEDDYPIEIISQGSIDFTCQVVGGTSTTEVIIAEVTTVDASEENPLVANGSITINVLVPTISLDISADPDPTYNGEETTITYTVTNTGNDAVTIESEDDIVESNQDCTPTTQLSFPINLEPNDVVTFTCTVTAGTSTLQFSATVTATAGNGDSISASDTLTVRVISPEITLEISSDPNPVPTGSTSLITYTVTNTGDSPVTIDGETGFIEQGTSGCVPFSQIGIITLQPNDVVTFTCTVTAGLSQIEFDAEATAFDENDREVTASAQHTLDVIPNIILSGIIRDFKISHPDFEFKISDDDGIVKVDLGGDGEPLYNGNPFTGTITTTGLVNYNQWYNHVSTVNDCTTYDITLEPSDTNPGYFVYANPAFFPIDGQLFGNEGNPHNYHFTYQIHATFVYQLGQTITMTGDDDVWVFIDNKLALDQGGVLPARTGTINLDTLGLTVGQTYSFDLFFAERHTTQSNLGIETNIPLIPSTPQQCKAVDAVNDAVFATTGPNTIDVTNNDVGFISISTFTQGMHGSVSQTGSSLVYTPTLGFEGIDLFTYTIINSSGDTDTAVVTVFVLADTICPLTPESYNVIMGDDSNNKLRGTNGNDLIFGNGGDDKIYGKKGNDCISGGAGNDKIWGGEGDDTISGGGGNDYLHGQQGNDTLVGGDGDDKAYGGKGNDTINAGAGNDRIHGNQDNDNITGGDGNDWIGAGIGNDTVNGGDGNDKIFGHQGHDTLNGNNNDDYIHGGQGNDNIDGGDGYDRCNGAQGNNTIVNCEVEDKKMKEEQEENDDNEGEQEDDDDDDDGNHNGNNNNGNDKGKKK
jgi:fibro-slime domain-containing protein